MFISGCEWAYFIQQALLKFRVINHTLHQKRFI